MIGMEYCAGGSLEQYVNGRRNDTMSEFIINSFAYEILLAMNDYSKMGYIHGNLKPDNILIDSLGNIKISGFGFARETIRKYRRSTGVDLSATYRRLSPELLERGEISEKTDVWAFGVILLELAYGKQSSIIPKESTDIREEFDGRGGYSSDMENFLSKCFEREESARSSVCELLCDHWFVDFKVFPAFHPRLNTKPSNNN